MIFKECKKCGRLFDAPSGIEHCSSCRTDSDERFHMLKVLIKQNPEIEIRQLSEESGVAEDLILRYIRQGKIELRNEHKRIYDCIKCGKPTTDGKYCVSCASLFKSDLKSAFKGDEGKETSQGLRNAFFTQKK